MKKILFMAFSLALAAGLFAFTVAQKTTTKKTDQLYYWYPVTYDGLGAKIEYGSQLSHISLADAEIADYDCPDQGRVCKAGFITDITFSGTDPYRTNTTGDVNFEEEDPMR
jgi:hypothetical protein